MTERARFARITRTPGDESERRAPTRAPSLGARTARIVGVKSARRVVVPLVVLVLWLGLTYGGVVRELFLPSPTDLWESFQGMRNQLPESLVSSVTMTLTGFLLGTSIGAGMGLAMAYSKVVRELFGDVLDFTRPVPIFALIPLFVLWFGIGRAPQIALIALGTSVILGVTTVEAIGNVQPVHIRAALTLGASRQRIYRTVILPAIFPHLLGAIRVAAAASWGLGVAAEFLGAQTGLGYLMIIRQQYLDTAAIIDIVIIYSVLAISLDFAIKSLEKPFTRWTDRQSRTGVVANVLGRT